MTRRVKKQNRRFRAEYKEQLADHISQCKQCFEWNDGRCFPTWYCHDPENALFRARKAVGKPDFKR